MREKHCWLAEQSTTYRYGVLVQHLLNYFVLSHRNSTKKFGDKLSVGYYKIGYPKQEDKKRQKKESDLQTLTSPRHKQSTVRPSPGLERN
jgi:hypothetical protein